MCKVCKNLTPGRPWNCSELVKTQIVSPFCQIYSVQLRNESVGHHRLHLCHHHCRPHYCYHNQPRRSRESFFRRCSSFRHRMNFSPSWSTVTISKIQWGGLLLSSLPTVYNNGSSSDGSSQLIRMVRSRMPPLLQWRSSWRIARKKGSK